VIENLRTGFSRNRAGRSFAAIVLGFAAVTSVAGPAAASTPQLTGAHPCAGKTGFTCSTLTVPLDHSGHVSGTLDLQVATADNTTAPKGTLLFLTGGPGQAGLIAATRTVVDRLPEVARDYRFVFIDQRGTGEFGALRCPQLQG
jgi:pimeloyl-ACP methyl ester carboxylesterase